MIQKNVGSDLAESKQKTAVVHKQSSISIYADELSPGLLDADLFAESGPPSDIVKTSEFALVRFDNVTFFVNPEIHRAVAVDNSAELLASSPIVVLMDKFVRHAKNLNIRQIWFNFNFELVYPIKAVNVVLPTYLRQENFDSANDIQGAGFTLVWDRSDHIERLMVAPMSENPFGVSVSVSFRHESPDPGACSDLINRFGRYVADVPVKVGRISNVE